MHLVWRGFWLTPLMRRHNLFPPNANFIQCVYIASQEGATKMYLSSHLSTKHDTLAPCNKATVPGNHLATLNTGMPSFMLKHFIASCQITDFLNVTRSPMCLATAGHLEEPHHGSHAHCNYYLKWIGTHYPQQTDSEQPQQPRRWWRQDTSHGVEVNHVWWMASMRLHTCM